MRQRCGAGTATERGAYALRGQEEGGSGKPTQGQAACGIPFLATRAMSSTALPPALRSAQKMRAAEGAFRARLLFPPPCVGRSPADRSTA